jgi:hypothetical protein
MDHDHIRVAVKLSVKPFSNIELLVVSCARYIAHSHSASRRTCHNSCLMNVHGHSAMIWHIPNTTKELGKQSCGTLQPVPWSRMQAGCTYPRRRAFSLVNTFIVTIQDNTENASGQRPYCVSMIRETLLPAGYTPAAGLRRLCSGLRPGEGGRLLIWRDSNTQSLLTPVSVTC